jgi:4-aminobutyrate aminotransferase/(S)-3-amino-2-methylpropionate transaminase
MVLFTRCGSCANESAFKAAFMAYRHRERAADAAKHGTKVDPTNEFSKEEIDSCLRNIQPGSPKLSILSFKSGFHGRLLASLSATRSKAIHKLVRTPRIRWREREGERGREREINEKWSC